MHLSFLQPMCLFSYPPPSNVVLTCLWLNLQGLGNNHSVTFLHWCSIVNIAQKIKRYLVVVAILLNICNGEETGQNIHDLNYVTDHCYFYRVYFISFFFVV